MNGRREGETMKRFHTLEEINSQPDAWAEALQVVQRQENNLERLCDGSIQQVIFTGCGSTFYLSLAGAALFQELTGRPARAIPASELLLNPQVILTRQHTLLVAVSRSGSTTETLKAVECFRQEHRGPVLAITNYGKEPLAGLGDLALVISAGQEKSVAQTRSFASMYLAAAAFAAVAGRQADLLKQMQSLPGNGQRLIALYDGLARQVGENMLTDRFYFLGSGSRYGLACEANLKMKEMTLTHSEPFHFLEFRHGPMSMVSPSARIIGLLSDRNRAHEQTVLDEMSSLGGQTLSLAETDADIALESKVAEAVRGVLYLPVLQMMAYYRSVAKGLDPDRPTNLSAVVQLAL
jgi:glutamine---fructose-6-phosphate transaminase (isomerizing)